LNSQSNTRRLSSLYLFHATEAFALNPSMMHSDGVVHMHGTEEERRKPPVLLSDLMSDEFSTPYAVLVFSHATHTLDLRLGATSAACIRAYAHCCEQVMSLMANFTKLLRMFARTYWCITPRHDGRRPCRRSIPTGHDREGRSLARSPPCREIWARYHSLRIIIPGIKPLKGETSCLFRMNSSKAVLDAFI
jgi:hypothetical protein